MAIFSFDNKQFELYENASEIFTPSSPTSNQDIFAGRKGEIVRIFDAILQKGQHVILFGDRGVGKTSLAGIVPQILRSNGYQGAISGVVNCNAKDTFDSIWRSVFRQFILSYKMQNMGFEAGEEDISISLDNLFPPGASLSPEDVRIFAESKIKSGVIIIDELDRIENNKEVSLLLSDTIKTFSDHGTKITIILVGVAESVIELIENHLSIERCLVQIQLPRLSKEERIEIIDNGMDILSISMTKESKDLISYLSKGMPNYVHALSLYSIKRAIFNNRYSVNTEDVYSSINDVIDNEKITITNSYEKAIFSNQNTIFKEILLACALAETDSLGYFTTSGLREPLSLILGRNVDIPNYSRQISKFCNPKKGEILIRKDDPSQPKYKFSNPLLEPYIMVRGLSEGLLPQEEAK